MRSPLSSFVGATAGILSAAFIEALDWTSDTRADHKWLLWMLPVAGLVVGSAYHYLGKGLERGSNLLIDQIHEHSEWIPVRMSVLIFVMLRLVPGNISDILFESAGLVNPAEKKKIEAELGLAAR